MWPNAVRVIKPDSKPSIGSQDAPIQPRNFSLLALFKTRCLDRSCEIMKWLTSSSAQYDKCEATAAMSEMSKAPLKEKQCQLS